MNVTTARTHYDQHQEQRLLEIALEHARAAGIAAIAASTSNHLPGVEDVTADGQPSPSIEVRYPSYQFREALRLLSPGTYDSLSTQTLLTFKIDLHKDLLPLFCTAALKVLRHYYPEEDFIVP